MTHHGSQGHHMILPLTTHIQGIQWWCREFQNMMTSVHAVSLLKEVDRQWEISPGGCWFCTVSLTYRPSVNCPLYWSHSFKHISNLSIIVMIFQREDLIPQSVILLFSCPTTVKSYFSGPVTHLQPNLPHGVVIRTKWRRGEQYKPPWVPLGEKTRM